MPVPSIAAAAFGPKCGDKIPFQRTLAAVFLVAAAGGLNPIQAADSDSKTTSAIKPLATDLPSGTYRLDPAHASLIFRVSHFGMSSYTGGFSGLDVELVLDSANPEASHVKAIIDPASLDLSNPPNGFKIMLLGVEWLNADVFPEIAFTSTAIELTDPDSARIEGDLSLHGVSRPVTLHASFNGGYASHPMDPTGSRIGFSAHGALQRSDFGILAGIPAPGTTFGVGDEVEFMIEAEFLRPVEPQPPAE